MAPSTDGTERVAEGARRRPRPGHRRREPGRHDAGGPQRGDPGHVRRGDRPRRRSRRALPRLHPASRRDDAPHRRGQRRRDPAGRGRHAVRAGRRRGDDVAVRHRRRHVPLRRRRGPDRHRLPRRVRPCGARGRRAVRRDARPQPGLRAQHPPPRGRGHGVVRPRALGPVPAAGIAARAWPPSTSSTGGGSGRSSSATPARCAGARPCPRSSSSASPEASSRQRSARSLSSCPRCTQRRRSVPPPRPLARRGRRPGWQRSSRRCIWRGAAGSWPEFARDGNQGSWQRCPRLSLNRPCSLRGRVGRANRRRTPDTSGAPRAAACRRPAARAWVILGVSGLAVTQPLLDLFGKNPEFFVAGNYSRAQIVLFALLIAFVPPLVGIALTAAASVVDRRAGTVVFGTVIAGLAAALVARRAAHARSRLRRFVFALAVLAGLGVAVLVVRTAWCPAFRLLPRRREPAVRRVLHLLQPYLRARHG